MDPERLINASNWRLVVGDVVRGVLAGAILVLVIAMPALLAGRL